MTQLNEKTTNANISTADFSFNKVIETFHELPSASIIRSIATVVPMKLSTGKVVNISRNGSTGSYEMLSANLTVNNNSATPLATGVSIEAIQDLHNQYGLDGYALAANMLRGIVDEDENTALMVFLAAESLSTPALTLTAAGNAEQSLFEITQRVQELVLSMNTPDFRTYDAFVILPYKNAASVSALNTYVGGAEADEQRLVVSKVGKTTYYVSTNAGDTTAYVGLVETKKNSVGASSIIVGDYQTEILSSTGVESFQQRVGIINRYATVVNPLSSTGAEMLKHFTIS